MNKPQEGLAPWIGYQEEDAMKAKVEFINLFHYRFEIIIFSVQLLILL